MKRTKTNVLRLLEAMMKHNEEMSKFWTKENEPGLSSTSEGTARGLQQAAWLLADLDYFNKLVDIYGVTEN